MIHGLEEDIYLNILKIHKQERNVYFHRLSFYNAISNHERILPEGRETREVR